MFKTMSILPWYTGLLLGFAEFFAMHHVRVFKPLPADFSLIDHCQIVTRVLLNKPSYTDNVNQSPYFAGIIFGSIIWVVFCWVTRLVNREHVLSFVCTC